MKIRPVSKGSPTADSALQQSKACGDQATQAAVESSGVQSLSEEQLIALWARALEVTDLGPEDSFFELGGTSMSALDLLLDVERLSGVQLAIDDLFAHPSPREFLAYLHRDLTLSSPIQPNPLRQFHCVQPIGQQTPLFSLAIAPHLGKERPVYYHPGLYGQIHSGEEVLSREKIEAWLLECLEDIQVTAPQGPVYLLGYCHGGWMALALAQALERKGRIPACVALLETHPKVEWLAGIADGPQRPQRIPHDAEAGSFNGRAAKVVGAAVYEVLDRLYDASSGRSTLKRLSRALPITPSLEERIVHWRNVKVFRTFERSVFESGLSAPLHLFLRAGEISPAQYAESEKAWRLIARGAVRLHQNPGDHLSVRQADNRQVLAQTLSQVLESLERC